MEPIIFQTVCMQIYDSTKCIPNIITQGVEVLHMRIYQKAILQRVLSLLGFHTACSLNAKWGCGDDSVLTLF